MENCARCGKQLEWHEQKMVFWNKQLKKGYIKWYVIGSREMGKRKEFPQYTGKKLCQICAHEVFTGVNFSDNKPSLDNQEKKIDAPQDAPADFASLRAFLTERGVVMSAYNCPKCSGMVDIPENGKILICKHCGNPIKPTDIYEKIKTLIE
jgi:DNA-directed RNA polymerase subunit RPC12/RpoP